MRDYCKAYPPDAGVEAALPKSPPVAGVVLPKSELPDVPKLNVEADGVAGVPPNGLLPGVAPNMAASSGARTYY